MLAAKVRKLVGRKQVRPSPITQKKKELKEKKKETKGVFGTKENLSRKISDFFCMFFCVIYIHKQKDIILKIFVYNLGNIIGVKNIYI